MNCEILSCKSQDELPHLVVFDLDYTLWPFWCDTHISLPLRLKGKGQLVDRCNYKINLYKDVVSIFEALRERSIPIAVASRTEDPEAAEELLKLLDLNKFISYKEIYPGSKVKHFANFKQNSGVGYDEMVFFDDEIRNITEISGIGVICCHVKNGVRWEDFRKALHEFKLKQFT